MEWHDDGSGVADPVEMLVAQLLKHREGLEEALTHGGRARTFSGVVADVVDGRAQVFYNDEAVVVTQLEDTEAGHRIVHIWLCAGERDNVLKITDRAEAWGRSMGAKIATTVGRRGWERLPAVRERGWKPDLTYYVKEL